MTGVPLVDAGMRQLKEMGWMHNRARMAVAYYLTKNLMVDWKEGEKHFAQWLTDYDPSVNLMNWMTIAAILPTDDPYRRMNPWIQTKKFDKDLIYIQRWVKELKHINDDEKREVKNEKRTISIGEYPKPIVDYTETRHEYKRWAKRNIKGYNIYK